MQLLLTALSLKSTRVICRNAAERSVARESSETEDLTIDGM